MGYETYLVEIRIDDFKNRDAFVKDLIDNNFALTESNSTLYLEKTYLSGIIEVCVSQTHITFRYAKPNLKDSLQSFLEELQVLSLKYPIILYDFYSKKIYKSEHFLDIIDSFEKSRNDFADYFPIDTYPIKSEDVLKKIK